ncbi:NADH-ubiquinone oxidoreductase chain [Tanacetum coccineum]
MKSRKRKYIQNTSEDDSDKENDELRLYLTIAQDEEKEVDYEILDRSSYALPAEINPETVLPIARPMLTIEIGIPPLAGFCSKFYLFFAALGCGAYFLAPVGVVTSVIGRWAAGRLPRVNRVESDTSTVYSISLYESTITTRDEPWFGELKLALGVIGLPVTVRDRILRCSPPVVGTTRAGPGLDSER